MRCSASSAKACCRACPKNVSFSRSCCASCSGLFVRRGMLQSLGVATAPDSVYPPISERPHVGASESDVDEVAPHMHPGNRRARSDSAIPWPASCKRSAIHWLGRDLRTTSVPPLHCGKGHSVLANPEPAAGILAFLAAGVNRSSRHHGLAAALGNRPAQGNEAPDAVPQRARREVEHRQLSRYRPQRTMKGVSLGQKPGRSGRVFSRGTGGASRFGAHEHAVPWPTATPLAGADLDLDELGDLFSVSRVRLAAGSGIPQVTSTFTGKAAYVRATATRAVAPDDAGPLVPCRFSASVVALATELAKLAVARFQAGVAASSSRFLIFASSCTAHAKLVRRRGGLQASRCAPPPHAPAPDRAAFSRTSPADVISFQRDASASRRASSRCRRVVASSKTHCLPVAQKSGVANSMKAQGSKFRVQSSGQIFSSPG